MHGPAVGNTFPERLDVERRKDEVFFYFECRRRIGKWRE